MAHALLPTFIAPDHSGQGKAMQLNSSVTYQYIELIRSPVFVNKSFTVSVWLYPKCPSNANCGILVQTYKDTHPLIMMIINRRVRLRVYLGYIESQVNLRDSQWQYVTFIFDQTDLSMLIFIDGVFNVYGKVAYPDYPKSEIGKTLIGGNDGFEQFNGIMDQLSVAYHVKSRETILDEAILFAYYDFQSTTGDLFYDISPNRVRAQGASVTRWLDGRDQNKSSLYLNNSGYSYFQSSGMVPLSTHNYSFSFALWLFVSNVSAETSLVHLVARDGMTLSGINDSTCLGVLTIKGLAASKFFFLATTFIVADLDRLLFLLQTGRTCNCQSICSMGKNQQSSHHPYCSPMLLGITLQSRLKHTNLICMSMGNWLETPSHRISAASNWITRIV